jgi:hypothetical protein
VAIRSHKTDYERSRIVEDKSTRHAIRSYTVELSERQAASLRTNVREIPGFKSIAIKASKKR